MPGRALVRVRCRTSMSPSSTCQTRCARQWQMAGVSAQHAAHKLTGALSGEVIHSGPETALTRVVFGADAGHNQLCLRQIDRLAGASATCGSGIMVSHVTGERELSLESVWSPTREVKTRRLTLSGCGCGPQRIQGWNTRGNAAGHAGAQLPAAQGAVCHQFALLHAGKNDEGPACSSSIDR